MTNSAPILLCAFGTTVPEARQSYRSLETSVKERFPSHLVRWAFTSSIVRRRLAHEGEAVFSPEEALEQFACDGFRTVVVQSVHVTAGQEFTRLTALSHPSLRIEFGRPLLDEPADYERVLEALAEQVRTGMPTIFVGHGNDNDVVFNHANLVMSECVRKRFPGAILASLEGLPGPAALDEIAPLVQAKGRAHFIPLLFVAGDHVLNDLMGNHALSWKNRLSAPLVTCGPPLGAYPGIRAIYLDHLADAVARSMSHSLPETD